MNITAMIATINGSSKLLFTKRPELMFYALSAELLCGAYGHRHQFTSKETDGQGRNKVSSYLRNNWFAILPRLRPTDSRDRLVARTSNSQRLER